MSSGESIAHRLHGKLDELIREVQDVEGKGESLHETEERLWQSMLKLGRELLQLRLEACREAEVVQDRLEVKGEDYAYQRRSGRNYVSLFGEVRVERAYYLSAERGGIWPLDAALSLPESSYSDSVQERLSEINVWMPQEQSVALLERWLGLKIPKGSLQSSTSQQALYVEDYYEQRPMGCAPVTDSILVATADGKGIPMTRADSPPPQARRSKGQKKTAKKEAIVTALYSVAPYVRDSASILAALLPDQTELPKLTPPRPTPSHKQTFGTLDGKTVALNQLAQQVARRDTSQVVYRVALTDGAESLQQRLQDQLPDFSLVLDIIHATEYLWNAANARWGETSAQRLPWIRQALSWLLDNQLDALLLDLQTQAQGLPAAGQHTLAHVTAYLSRNRPFMDYQRYLALGWPIGTGVIEGACRHLVKDRFEQAGMRWSKAGAQSLLDLRSVAFNDDWDDFQRFRRQQAHTERYDFPYPDSLPDVFALEAAA
jgi:Uncharacterised protein family (UPF0236)